MDSGEITLQSVHAVLHDVHVPVMDLARGQRVQVTAATGTGAALVTADEITRVLQKQGLGVTVEFDQGHIRDPDSRHGRVRHGQRGDRGRDLVLRSSVLASLLPSVNIPLPEVVPGVRYTSVRVGKDAAVLGFELQDATFNVGG